MAKKKNNGGRPSDYSEDVLKKAKQYLADCQDEDVQVVKQANVEKGYEMYENRLKVNLPSIAGLAIVLGIWRSTIYKWADKHPAFKDILEAILAEQEKRLVENGLGGTYNSNIVKLALGKHGYSDKQELTGKDGGPVQVQDIEVSFAKRK